ncbi:MAG: hypothetical protein ACOC44_17975 [Promethearchaeia archaeon]
MPRYSHLGSSSLSNDHVSALLRKADRQFTVISEETTEYIRSERSEKYSKKKSAAIFPQ